MFYLFTRFIFYKNLILILSISFISCNIQDNFKTNFPNNDFDKNLAGKAPIYSQKNIGLNIQKKILLLLSYPKTI